MPDCPASDQSSTEMKKLTTPGLVRYQIKPRQFGIFLVRYQTDIVDAGADAGVSFLDADALLCLYIYMCMYTKDDTGMNRI
jgi:hypothetical protein